jgi:hypothetical protein
MMKYGCQNNGSHDGKAKKREKVREKGERIGSNWETVIVI